MDDTTASSPCVNTLASKYSGSNGGGSLGIAISLETAVDALERCVWTLDDMDVDGMIEDDVCGMILILGEHGGDDANPSLAVRCIEIEVRVKGGGGGGRREGMGRMGRNGAHARGRRLQKEENHLATKQSRR